MWNHKWLGRNWARHWHLPGGAGVRNPRPRVLIEEPDVVEAKASWRLLEENGYEVSWCPGPAGSRLGRCPLVTSGQCDLVCDADVVVTSLALDSECSRKVVSAHRYLHPETPFIIDAPAAALAQWAPVFERRWGAIRMPVTRRTLLDSVEFALADSPAQRSEEATTGRYAAPIVAERWPLSYADAQPHRTSLE
jgi:hypothetical protein